MADTIGPFTANDLELFRSLEEEAMERAVINPKCHPKSPVRLLYYFEQAVLTGVCQVCGRGVLNFQLERGVL